MSRAFSASRGCSLRYMLHLNQNSMFSEKYQARYIPFFNIRQYTQINVYLIKKYGFVRNAYVSTKVSDFYLQPNQPIPIEISRWLVSYAESRDHRRYICCDLWDGYSQRQSAIGCRCSHPITPKAMSHTRMFVDHLIRKRWGRLIWTISVNCKMC